MNEDKATRYQRLRRRAAVGSAALTGALLVGLLVSGGAVALREVAAVGAGFSEAGTGLVFIVAIALLNELLLLPVVYYQGVTLERRYGLATQSITHWWLDHAKAAVLGLSATLAAGLAILLFLRWTPQYWWVIAAAVFIIVLVVLTQLAPVVFLPMFDATVPLRREGLVERLMTLATRADTRVVGVFEWRLGARTKKANAALTGIGPTRRILLSDTLLAEHSDDEIEVILAHELAHHVHHDIWTAIAFEAVLIAIAAWAADLALMRLALPLDLAGKSDPAGLPLVALTFGATSLLAMPLVNALSRAHERRADRYALKMTGNVAAFISAMKRLGAQNLSDDRPSRLIEYVFYTHPPVAARISAAQAWSAREQPAAGSRSGQRTVGSGQ